MEAGSKHRLMMMDRPKGKRRFEYERQAQTASALPAKLPADSSDGPVSGSSIVIIIASIAAPSSEFG